MDIYLVGGAVRDQLLGLPVKEKDYVVVGATPEALLAQGFQPVGKDFPVFLHPTTHEEYALARTERKQGRGYKGFNFYYAPDVTLEQDLNRRDLTMNAIAQDQSGQLYDPFHGKADIENRIMRHVSPAFEEDPLRVLRIARFMARFAEFGFQIAPETKDLLKKMVELGELHDLTPERVWQEMARALATKHPSVFFKVLEECGALQSLFPEWWRALDALQEKKEKLFEAVDQAAQSSASVDQCFAVLFHILFSEKLDNFCKKWRIPKSEEHLSKKTKEFLNYLKSFTPTAEKILAGLEEIDAIRRPQLLQDLSFVAQWLCYLEQIDQQKLSNTLKILNESLKCIAKLHFSDQEKLSSGPDMKALVRAKRLQVINDYLAANKIV